MGTGAAYIVPSCGAPSPASSGRIAITCSRQAAKYGTFPAGLVVKQPRFPRQLRKGIQAHSLHNTCGILME